MRHLVYLHGHWFLDATIQDFVNCSAQDIMIKNAALSIPAW